MPARHMPERTCVACRLQQPKRVMVRIVRRPSGYLEVDRTGKLSGRGAYLCQQQSCWDLALRKDALARALKMTLTAEDRARLTGFAADLALDGASRATARVAEGVEHESTTRKEVR